MFYWIGRRGHDRTCMVVGFITTLTVKPVYKDHSREPENVAFMSS